MKKCILLACFSFVLALSAWSQNQLTVTGTITDNEDGLPLENATVSLKGSSLSTITGKDGKFSIKAASNDALVITYTGYEKQTISIKGQPVINIKLSKSGSDLGEVVIVGYGIRTFKKDNTAATSKIDKASLENTAPVNISEVLQGRAAGVNIVSNDGTPGAGFSINIRGLSTITAGSNPLIVIDNIPYTNSANDAFNPLASINPNDIESIDILKDASATALYGVGASNGVIVITTKQGKSAKPKFTFSSKVGFGELARTINTLSPKDYALYRAARYRSEAGDNSGFATSYIPLPGQPGLWELLANPTESNKLGLDAYDILKNQYGVTNFDGSNWLDLITQTNTRQFYDLGFSGSTQGGTSYFASLGYANEKGNIINSGFRRLSARLNLDQKISNVFSASLKFQYANSAYTGLIGDNRADNAIGQANFLNPFINRDNIQGSSEGVINNGGQGANPESPEFRVKQTDAKRASNSFNGNISVSAKPFSWLEFVLQGGVINDDSYRNIYIPSQLREAFTVKGRVDITDRRDTRFVFQPRMSVNKKFGDHRINGTFVFEARKDIANQYFTRYEQFGTEVLGGYSLASAQSARTTPSFTDVRVRSYIGRIQYDFQSKYVLTVSTRVDESSRFVKDKTGVFPAVSVAWNIADEKFMDFASNVLSTFKLRAGYGITGNDQIPNNAGIPLGNISNVFYPFNNGLTTIVNPNNRFANPDITWETTKGINLGLDLGFLNDRFALTTNYYNNTNTNILLDIQLPGYSGFASSIKNIGSMRNTGFEFELVSRNATKGKLKWTTNFNISFNRNEILDLGGVPELGFKAVGAGGLPNDVLLRIGQPIGVYYGTIQDGLVNTDLERYNSARKTQDNNTGEFQFFDVNGDGIIDRDEYVPIAYTLPIHTGGMGNTLTYRGIELYAFLRWSYGNDNVNNNINRAFYLRGDNNLIQDVVNSIWNRQNQDANYQSTSAIFTTRINSLFSRSEMVEDGSYLRLETVRLGYALPAKWLKRFRIPSARISITGQNLFVLTRYSWYDPEVNTATGVNRGLFPGLDQGAYPRSRFLLFGLDLTF
ncbi:TonB-dependent receptor [Lacibacter sp.]|uniref:SusC/RagA family TonB-linked outer membrane protein n=1 Tax=Lacibacter sp. TaxID=1915409 RepID=UPI002B4B8581|nr:TonB-dependent receptor [Lacibacter sp.]HLP37678.1 TonB-dependent receptor [Lacibacter sp.]